MDKESRDWFDNAYDFTRGLFPFGILIGYVSIEDMKRICHKFDMNDEELKKVRYIASQFYKKMPPEEDFQEEKENILNTFVPELREKLDFVRSVIIFGRIKGDIDIGLISSYGIPDDQLFGAIQPGCEFVKKYPIVDWDSIIYFKSRSGGELASRIIDYRLIHDSTKKMSHEQLQYIENTIYNAKLIWGDMKELDEMKKTFEEIKIK